MAEEVTYRLSRVLKEINVGFATVQEYLSKEGVQVDTPNAKIDEKAYGLLMKKYQGDIEAKKKAEELADRKVVLPEPKKEEKPSADEVVEKPTPKVEEKKKAAEPVVETKPEPEPKPKPKPEKEVKPISSENKDVEKQPVNVEEKVEVKAEKTEKSKPLPTIKPAEENKDIKKEEKQEVKPSEKQEVKQEQPSIVVEKTAPKDNESKLGVKVLGKIDLAEKKSQKHDKNEQKHHENKKHHDEKPQASKDNGQKKDDFKNAEPKKDNVKKEIKSEVKPEIKKETSVQSEPKKEAPKSNFIETKVQKLEGPKVLGKIDLTQSAPKPSKDRRPVASSGDAKVGQNNKKKRKRIETGTNQQGAQNQQNNGKGKPQDSKHGGKNGRPEQGKNDKFGKKKPFVETPELTDEEIQKQIRETLARLSPLGKSKTSKHRREKRQRVGEELEEEMMLRQEDKKILRVTEFVTANELATMMNVPVTKVISTCMSLGMFVSINQRLNAEILALVAEEFGFKVEFTSIDVQEAIAEQDVEDNPEDLVQRAPIVTVMGHVDHGKTKLLDFIRHSNVVAGEAGGITQHIGAYEVTNSEGKKVTFLDTPGHEAFTAMRARGASITDVAIIVIAADDSVMPQTIEAINHAQAANVPIVFAINKIDKPTSNPQKIYEQLANMNILVEEWGGKYQSQEISAKEGRNVDKLLDKVLLEAEMLDLKGNPKRLAKGAVIESALDKGRGYVAKILVQDGTLHVGDIVLAGTTFGKVKAMFNERNQAVQEAGPSTPVLLLGLSGAPQAGDGFIVMNDEKEAKTIVTRRQQLQREQGLRTQKHITLDEIGRRLAIGDFKELNIIVKADVDGSVEALSDSLLKLSTEEVQVNVIHKAVGAISESDISLASASDAVIVAFNVRPTAQARKLAEREQIDIRVYSIIYTAIEEIKSAIEGMLAPKIEEVVTCNIEIREVFDISKVGRIAGCQVLDGKVNRQTKIRIIRDGIVIHTGTLGSLKRFKDDVKEVSAGFECGLNIQNFNDIKVGDIIEGYVEKEVSRKL
ncbi:MAG: translation initiation factor IF-2 [Bacteroidales bacterium]|nr:translation initiation factor IF-2 [Bacteroidales bacterium]